MSTGGSSLLIVRRYPDVLRYKSFDEFRSHVNSDQCWEWRKLYQRATGRSLNTYFSGIPDEYWPAFAEMIQNVKDIVDEINKRLLNMDWRELLSVNRILEGMKSENAANGKSPSYMAIMEEVAADVLVYSSLGREAAGFDESSLFDIVSVIPLDESEYDIFISYKTRNHAEQAKSMAEYLAGRGYRIWFDQKVLEKKGERTGFFEKRYLLDVLRNGVEHSKCTLIFEAQLSAYALPPGMTEEQAVKENAIMMGPQGIHVAWDWQVVEIMASRRALAIHPRTIAIFDRESGSSVRYEDYSGSGLRDAVDRALSLLGV